MEKSINWFVGRLCRSTSAASLSPSDNCIGTYSSLSLIEAADAKKSGPLSPVEHLLNENDDDDGDEDAYICEIGNSDQYRICKARTAPDSVVSEVDSYLLKKSLTGTATPRQKTQDLITKLDEVTKIVDLTLLLHYKNNAKIQFSALYVPGSTKVSPSTQDSRKSYSPKPSSDTVKRLIDYS